EIEVPSASKARRAPAARVSPGRDAVTCLRVRTTRGVPTRSSSRRMARLTDGWLTPSARAARVKLPLSMTASSAASAGRSRSVGWFISSSYADYRRYSLFLLQRRWYVDLRLRPFGRLPEDKNHADLYLHPRRFPRAGSGVERRRCGRDSRGARPPDHDVRR